MSIIKKSIGGFLSCAILSSCASAPPSSPLITTENLYLCRGINVSNAPITNAKGQVTGFQATRRIRGLSLLSVPAEGCLASGFGTRTHKTKGKRAHNGIDISTRGSVPIMAGGTGIITFIGNRGRYGRLIEITHMNGIKTRYAHLSVFAKSLKVGQKVDIGQHIGLTGKSGNATGIHLHYEIIIDDQNRDPLDF